MKRPGRLGAIPRGVWALGLVSLCMDLSSELIHAILPLFDQAKAAQGGSTIPIKLQLTNHAGATVSSSSTVVTAVKLVQISTNASSDVSDSGNANPDGNFRFDGSGYIFNLSTKGLATGTYQLVFTVSGDATPHSVNFQVR